MILAHAHAVKSYRDLGQGGSIGIVLNMDWKEPLTTSASDALAQRRALDWQLGWFADPIYRGDYPETMQKRCGERLPCFTPAEKAIVKGSSDFFGLNHYSSDFVTSPDQPSPDPNYFVDQQVKNISDPRWSKTDMGWDVVPWGFERLISWIHKEYTPAGGIIVTENGCASREVGSDLQNDSFRVEYLQSYLSQLHKAISNGADVRGYFVWSFLDNFEWAFGYAKRFGIVRVDFATQERTPKASARLLSKLVTDSKLHVPSRLYRSSEFTPFNSTPKELASAAGYIASKPSTRPQVSTDDGKRMLKEFCARYEDDGFQRKMVSCFERFMIHNDEMTLLKARRSICMPIQAEILPKYGFEPTARGVSQAQAALTSPTLTQDPEIQQLNYLVTYLTTEKPRAIAAEGATV
eukprot:TRINITY_DN21033_c0_g1_i2.p1 TRINITY_DN21033_c0_g1~~TRINITY_DN21033_c0_g1_i2.p1  ORF type:complete len:407 (+),score=73.88 TRINITY_DN21033_c0_g1_i2:471-1691(+)